MLRFNIRDLLWVTVVAAIGLGWAIRERQFRSELEQATSWRKKAEALQRATELRGWIVEWGDASVTVLNPDDQWDLTASMYDAGR